MSTRDKFLIRTKYLAVLYLLVHGRIPVAVVEDDRVRSRQVDTQATCPGRQQEHKDVLEEV